MITTTDSYSKPHNPINMFIRSYVEIMFFFLLISNFYFYSRSLKTADNYGPYVLEFNSYELCKGPKAVNLTQEIFSVNKANGIWYFNFTYLVDTRIDEVRVIVLSENKGAKHKLWNYRIKEPCRHFMVGAVIRPYFKTENCVVKKGSYACQLNCNDLATNFLGSSFFYGTFSFKSILTSKTGNIHCLETKMSFSKLS